MEKLKRLGNDLLYYGTLAIVGLAIYGGIKSTFRSEDKLKQLAQTSAMITRIDGKSGGSGVVISSSENSSVVLTNSHVCEVVVNGGRVVTDLNSGMVVDYKQSLNHDLCLITTNVNLHAQSKITNTPPSLYDEAIVIGHPQLLPTITQIGTFSHKKIITIMAGFRPCTREDFENGNAGLCMYLGGIPVIVRRETQVISAFISPGSSGSPVFNRSGEISGLVFAGSGEVSYGLIVPAEHVYNFINTEAPNLTPIKPNDSVTVDQARAENKLKEACLNKDLEDYTIVQSYCEQIIDNDIYW